MIFRICEVVSKYLSKSKRDAPCHRDYMCLKLATVFVSRSQMRYEIIETTKMLFVKEIEFRRYKIKVLDFVSD